MSLRELVENHERELVSLHIKVVFNLRSEGAFIVFFEKDILYSYFFKGDL